MDSETEPPRAGDVFSRAEPLKSLKREVTTQTARVLRGKLKDERTIELDEPVGNVAAEVEVILRSVGPAKPAPLCETLSPQEWKKMFHAWIVSHDPDLPVLPEEARRRESIYEDRW